MRGELAERKPGSGVEIQLRKLLLHHREARQPVDVERRLTNRGLGQFLGRSLEGKLRERISKDFIRLLEKRGRGRIFGAEILAHANRLGTLTGKEESEFFCHK